MRKENSTPETEERAIYLKRKAKNMGVVSVAVTRTQKMSAKKKQRILPQMNRRTISRHFNHLIDNFHIDRKRFTRQNVVIMIFTAAFWIPIYLLGGYLTIDASTHIIDQYQVNPIYLSMAAMINQPTVKYPNFTVCLNFNLTQHFDAIDVINRNDSNSSYMENLEIFFMESINNGKISPKKWPDTTNGVLVRYLIMMYGFESIEESPEDALDWLAHQQMNDEYWLALKNVLIPKITEYNISIDQLKEAVFDGSSPWWSSKTNCIFFTYDKNDEVATCASSKLISFIGYENVCYQFNNIEYWISPNEASLADFRMIVKSAVGETWPVSLDFSGRSTPPPQTLSASKTDVFEKLTNMIEVNIDITAYYRSLPGVYKICSLNSTLEDCWLRCRSSFINKLCGCMPITFSTSSYASKYLANCTFDQYEMCSKSLSGNNDQYCRNNCVPKCDQWFFDIEILSKKSDFLWPEQQQTISMHMGSFNYLSMTETYQWTFETFISALGGAICLWLGLNFVVLIEFVFNPIMMLLRKILSHKGRTNEESGNRQINETEGKSWWQKILQLSHEYGSSGPLTTAWYFEKIFWAVIYIVGGSSTANYCWGLTQIYLMDATQFNVEILHNESITLPDAKLCFDLGPGNGFYYAANSENVGKQMVLTNELETYFNQTTTSRDIFFNSNRNWPEVMAFAAFLYISMMTQYELDYQHVTKIFDSDQFIFQSSSSENATYGNHVTDLEMNDIEHALTKILLPKLLEWNVTIDELRQKVGQEFYQYFNVEIKFFNSQSRSSSAHQTPRTTYITENTICYQLMLSETTFLSDSDYLEISSLSSHQNFETGTVMVFFTDIDFVNYQLPVNRLSNNYGTIFHSQYGKTYNYSLAIGLYYESLSVVQGVEKCTNGFTDEAAWLCYYASIKDSCNCIPTAYPLMSPPPTPGIVECNLLIYNNCGIIESRYPRVSVSPECRDFYPPPCATWSFLTAQSFSTNDAVFVNERKYDATVVRFSVKNLMYAAILEQRIYTFSQFVPAFGGMLGIWLGLSFFSLVQIVAFPTELILGLFLRKPNEKLSKIIDPEKNLKLKKKTSSRLFLTVQYVFDFNLDNFLRGINLQKVLTHTVMTIFYVLGTIATIFMCLDLRHRYIIGQTISTVEFLNGDTFTLPKSIMCLSNNMLDFIRTDQNISYEDPLKEIANFNDKETFLNANWSNSLLQLAFEHQAFYAQIERSGDFQYFLRKATPIPNDKNTTFDSFLNNWTAINNFDRHLRILNITAEEERQKCGNEFKKIVTIDVKHLSVGTQLNTSSLNFVKETTFISDNTICYNLQLNEQVFTSKSEALSLSVKRRLLPDEANSSLSIDLSGRESNLNLKSVDFVDGSILTAIFGQMAVFQIKIGAVYEASSFGNGEHKCSQEITFEDCQDECRIAWIQKNCHCAPVSWSSSTATTGAYCSFDDYMNCFQPSSGSGQNNLNFQIDFSSCSSKCLPYCTLIRYEKQRQTSFIDADQAEIVIEIPQFAYFVFSESFALTFSSLISQFGGYLCIWVGLDFLIFLQLFYTFMCILLRIISIVIKKGVVPDQEETPVYFMVEHSSDIRASIPSVEVPNRN